MDGLKQNHSQNSRGSHGVVVDDEKVLRQRLDHLLAQARHNEQKLHRFQSLELRLIGLDSLSDLIQAILTPPQSVFRWEVVTLTLLDPEYEIRRVLEAQGIDLADFPNLLFSAGREPAAPIMKSLSLFPTLGPYIASKHSTLFPAQLFTPSSVALLPLVRYGKLIGSLNIGSAEKTRFLRGMRADFFEHLAAVVAICLENAVNTERLKRQGLTDTLTGVNNRRFFDQRLAEELEYARRKREPLSCLLLDVDHFKRINDTYGHQAGDEVLQEFARVIRTQLRGSDVLARYGGEEFAALLADTDAAGAIEISERIRTAIEQCQLPLSGSGKFSVTLSIGIATYLPDARTALVPLSEASLVGYADRALYDAKSMGRNRVVHAGTFAAEQ